MWPAVPAMTCFMEGDSGEGAGDSVADLAQLSYLLLVVLAKEDVPLRASLGDGSLLRDDLCAHAPFDLLVLAQLPAQELEHEEADLVAVLLESHAGRLLEGGDDDVGEMDDLLVTELHVRS